MPDEYAYFAKNRKKCNRKSGGIIIVFKKALSKYLKFLTSESEFVQWVEFSKDLSEQNDLDSKILFGCIYIPPENSKYSSEEAFTEIEEELISFSGDHNNIALVGDFNSRTGNVSDIVEIDDNLFDILDIVDVAEFINENIVFVNNFLKKGIPPERFTEDKNYVNNYGRRLIEFCKRCSVYIANGRLHNDKFIGKNTCKDASLVDYLILSPNIFDFVSEFEILDFNPMLSDVHNQMHISLSFSHKNICNTHHKVNNNKDNTYVRWNTNKAEEFNQVLGDDNILIEIEHTLDNLDIASVTHEQVNDILNEVGNVLLNTASNVFGSVGKKQTKSLNSKPWFTTDCKKKRDEFHKNRNNYRKFKTDDNKVLMNRTAKEYRHLLNISYKKYHEKCANELRSLSKSNTKAFWKTLHKYSSKQKENPTTEIETFYEYFKKLNAGDGEEAGDDSFNIDDICNNPIYDEILNGEITELEIIEAIKELKNSKAPGTDKILNEYLKYSTPLLISIYDIL